MYGVKDANVLCNLPFYKLMTGCEYESGWYMYNLREHFHILYMYSMYLCCFFAGASSVGKHEE